MKNKLIPIIVRNKSEFSILKIGSIVNVKRGVEDPQLRIYVGKKDCGESFISRYYEKNSVASIRSPLEKITFLSDGTIGINEYENYLFVYEPNSEETSQDYKTSKQMLQLNGLWENK